MGDRGRWDASGHWLRWDGERPLEPARPARAAAGALVVTALAAMARLRHR